MHLQANNIKTLIDQVFETLPRAEHGSRKINSYTFVRRVNYRMLEVATIYKGMIVIYRVDDKGISVKIGPEIFREEEIDTCSPEYDRLRNFINTVIVSKLRDGFDITVRLRNTLNETGFDRGTRDTDKPTS